MALLLVSALEYFGRYTTPVRAGLFYTWLILAMALLAYYVVVPLAQLTRIGNRLSYKDAAAIVGRHFPEVSDRLLNTLELMSMDTASNQLLAAAIQQRTNDLKPFPFASAVDYKSNVKYLRFAVIPVAALVLILLVYPSLVSDGAKRVVQYNQVFKVPPPFDFRITNDHLQANQHEDFELNVEVSGKEVPAEVTVQYRGQAHRMVKDDPTHFRFQFHNLQKSESFYLEAAGFRSEDYMISVRSKPVMLACRMKLNYPSYLGMPQETRSSPGDLTIPAGTTVEWMFTGKETKQVLLNFMQHHAKAVSEDGIHYKYQRRFFLSDAYAIVLGNDEVPVGDSLYFQVQVVPDAFPVIEAEERRDTVSGMFLYFGGNAEDDHGLSKIEFKFRYTKSSLQAKSDKGLQSIPINGINGRTASFTHVLSLYDIGFSSGDELEYYFEVWDNDGVHGPKSSRSKTFLIKAPGQKELKEQANAAGNALQQKMEETLKEARDLTRDMKDLEKKLKTQQPLTWEEKKKLENIAQRQKELAEKLEELRQDFQLKNVKEQVFKEEDQRILEKQQQLQKMYEEVMTDEMKKLMKQFEEMLKQQNKDQIKKEMEQMELGNKDVEKELDRMLEMYKQLEVEKRMEDVRKEISDLSQKQRELADQTEQKKSSSEELKKQQDELKQRYEDLKKELSELEQKNKELEDPKGIPDMKEEQKSIDDHMQKSSDELSKGNNKKSAKEQKEAADELDKMEQKMKEQQEKEEEEQEELDENALREILENLIQLSKDQEDLMEQMKQVNGYSPQFVKLAQQQKLLKDNAKIIEDSLLALSKRAPQVKAIINREVTKMNHHLEQANINYSNRNQGEIRAQQQYAMTRMNNLGVMLSEALNQMQQESQMKMSSKSGKGKPKKKPGNGKPSMSQMRKMQEQMNKQLQDGLNKNGSGEKGKSSSEQFARMAAQQMAIRQQMQQMLGRMDALEKEKLGGGKQLGQLQKMMEETEKELVNKRLTRETLMRQQDILTRLLEHEKAERKQEEEQRREATQGKDLPKPSPQYLEPFMKKKKNGQDLLEQVPPEMQPWYKQKYKDYMTR